MIDMESLAHCGGHHSWGGGTGPVRKQVEKAMGSKSVIRVPP